MTRAAIFDLDGVVRAWDPEIIGGAERRAGLPSGSLEARLGAVARTAVDAEVLAIVREVRRTRPVALHSNATSRLRSDLAALGLLSEFDHVINSSELGLAKPDPRVFVQACRRIGSEMSACWFVDDSARNVHAAAGAGLRAHHFVGAPALRAWIDAQPGDR